MTEVSFPSPLCLPQDFYQFYYSNCISLEPFNHGRIEMILDITPSDITTCRSVLRTWCKAKFDQVILDKAKSQNLTLLQGFLLSLNLPWFLSIFSNTLPKLKSFLVSDPTLSFQKAAYSGKSKLCCFIAENS